MTGSRAERPRVMAVRRRASATRRAGLEAGGRRHPRRTTAAVRPSRELVRRYRAGYHRRRRSRWLRLVPCSTISPPIRAAVAVRQTRAEADAKSAGCLSCHAGIEPMHEATTVVIGCTDCHGGDAQANAGGAAAGQRRVRGRPARGARAAAASQAMGRSERSRPHQLGQPGAQLHAAQPRVAGVHPLRQPGRPARLRADLRRLPRQGDASDGAQPDDHLGDALGRRRLQQRHRQREELHLRRVVHARRRAAEDQYRAAADRRRSSPRGVLPFLVPLPRWNVVQPPDPFRTFERGGKVDRSSPAEVGNPNLGPFLDEPGKPDMKVGTRGLGTELRIAAGVLNLHKTRLNDPLLSFLGTNDNPGDYRSSGCTACHVVYANDRDPVNSGPYADIRQHGHAITAPTRPSRKDEPGHPIAHRLTRAIPTSQCMICHMHQPNSFVNTYLGYQMWDYETDGDLLWPKEQRYRTEDEPTPFNENDFQAQYDSLIHNPEEAAARGLWTDIEFLKDVSRAPDQGDHASPTTTATAGSSAPSTRRTARATCSTARASRSTCSTPRSSRRPSTCMDIHAEKGMHCVDCHFEQDVHGNGKLYGEYPNAVEIQCQDCHGTINTPRDAAHQRAGGAEGRQRSASAGLTPFARAPLRVGRRRADPALDAAPRARVEGVAGARQHRPARALSTTRRRASRRPSSATARPGARCPSGRTRSRTATTRWPATPVTRRG